MITKRLHPNNYLREVGVAFDIYSPCGFYK
jgi:hypothetical protein